MPFVKLLLNVQEVGTSRVLLINLILLPWKNLKGVLVLFKKKIKVEFPYDEMYSSQVCGLVSFTCVTHTPIKIQTVSSLQIENTGWS